LVYLKRDVDSAVWYKHYDTSPICIHFVDVVTETHPTGRCGVAVPQTPQNRNLKNTDFVYIISKVIRNLPFSRNRPLN
jgi:hypothetical protein